MGLHTTYVGRVLVEPWLSPEEVEFLRTFSATRHWDHPDGPLRLADHPSDDFSDSWADVNTSAPGLPGLWCPWTPCPVGCCLRWDGVEKPYQGEAWLRWLIDMLIAPSGGLVPDSYPGTGGHRCNGVLVVERHGDQELFALHVVDNVVRRHMLVPAVPGVDEYGYGAPEDDLALRQAQLDQRNRRFQVALAADHTDV